MTAERGAVLKIFLIAGEPSGDALGAALITALRTEIGTQLVVQGVGGERMRDQGLDSLVPLRELAVMGLAEILPRAVSILRRVREVVIAIEQAKPDAVVTIDSSGFTWRVAERLRARSRTPPLIHYVAPMVWAWRPGRARKMVRWFDHLMALLPFEPPYFEKVGLPCSYVGHPVIESGADRGDGPRFRAANGIGPEEILITVLPGSRGSETSRLLPVFGEALHALERRVSGFRIVVPTVENVADQVRAAIPSWPGRPIILQGPPSGKYDAFAASDAALAASGTVALELAMARLPMVVAYRVNPVTEWLVRRMVAIEHVNLVNLILGRGLVPELLGSNCTAANLAEALGKLCLDERVRADHRRGYAEAMQRLGLGVLSPSRAAAETVLSIIAAHRGAGRFGAIKEGRA